MSRRVARPTGPQIIRVSPKLAGGLSDYRKGAIEEEINRGTIVEGGTYESSHLKRGAMPTPSATDENKISRGAWLSAQDGVSMGNARRSSVTGSNQISPFGAVVHSEAYKQQMSENIRAESIRKIAASVGTSGGGAATSSGSSVERLAPEVYSPLFTMANLNLPRDRTTVNAWIRNFFLLHPIVRNVITLHATYPISKINLKCHDPKVRVFFEDMMEEADALTMLGDLALEHWKMGEVFPFCEFDEGTGKWSRFIIQNPDYIHVKKAVLGGEPLISLRPDQVLQRLVLSNNPADVQLRQQIPPNIIHAVRTGQDIRLDNFNVSHLKMLSSPYDVRGTSIIVSAFKDLMLYDKLRECYSTDTEVLTKDGFKFYDEVTDDDVIGTFNSNTNQLEYQKPVDRFKKHYDGDMYRFSGKKIDMLVTPGHRMWLAQSRSHGNGYHNFDFIEAQNIKKGYFYKTRCVVDWQGKEISEVDVCGYKIPAEDYMKILGHLVAEGCISYNTSTYQYGVGCNQSVKSEHIDSIRNSMTMLAGYCDKHLGIRFSENTRGFSLNNHCSMENWKISNKALSNHFADEIGTNSHNKHLPQWVKELSPELLDILLTALSEGDARINPSKYGTSSIGYRYSTISKQLADDIQEIAFKCGYAPLVDRAKNGQGKLYWSVAWSNTVYGCFPIIYGNRKDSGNGGGATFRKTPYSGEVFCFEVPNGLFVTRRNGKITIQGNCKYAQADGLVNPITIVKVGGTGDGDYRATAEDLEYFRQMLEEAQYDKDFKLVTHAGVDITRVGASGQVLEISEDMNLIIKNIYTALMIPPAVIDQESSVYASASIGLEVLRQRYFNFRNMIARWLTNKVFAPISEVQGFFEYKDGKKRLIVPEVEWNQMNLYDLSDYIQNITGLVGSKQASVQTLYRSLGLNYDDEKVKMRQERIDTAIVQREEQALATMSLSELRALDPEKPISEPAGEQQPEGGAGMAMPPEAGGLAGAPGGGGMPPMGGGGLGGGLPELAPPPAPGGAPGAGAPEIPGGTPPLGPGAGAGGSPGV